MAPPVGVSVLIFQNLLCVTCELREEAESCLLSALEKDGEEVESEVPVWVSILDLREVDKFPPPLSFHLTHGSSGHACAFRPRLI